MHVRDGQALQFAFPIVPLARRQVVFEALCPPILARACSAIWRKWPWPTGSARQAIADRPWAHPWQWLRRAGCPVIFHWAHGEAHESFRHLWGGASEVGQATQVWSSAEGWCMKKFGHGCGYNRGDVRLFCVTARAENRAHAWCGRPTTPRAVRIGAVSAFLW